MFSTRIRAVLLTCIAAVTLGACQSADDPAATVRLGSMGPNGFEAGKLAVALDRLSPRGRTSFSALLVDSDNRPITLVSEEDASGGEAVLDGSDSEPGDLFPDLTANDLIVDVSSSCADQGLALIELDDIQEVGVASIRGDFIDVGCGRTENLSVTVTVSSSGRSVSATADIVIDPIGVESVNVVGIEHQNLRLTGLDPDSTRIDMTAFELGGIDPARDRVVSVSVKSKANGATLNQSQVTTNSEGSASVTLSAGRVPEVVQVEASIIDQASGIRRSTLSEPIEISLGVPTDSGMSLGTTCFNIEGQNVEGNTTTLQIQASDRNASVVADGVLVRFASTAGAVVPSSCALTDGVCTVNLRTQDPRSDDGIARVIAYAVGEENFIDTNGDQMYTPGESFVDMPEPFIDLDGDEEWDLDEFYLDANNNGQFDGPNGQFDGYRCNGGVCSLAEDHLAFDLINITMSTSDGLISLANRTGFNGINGDGAYVLPALATGELAFNVTDANGNLMGEGTTVALRVVSETAPYVTLTSDAHIVSCGLDRTTRYAFPLTAADIPASLKPGENAESQMLLEVRSPSGVLTSFPFSVASPQRGNVPQVTITASPLTAEVGEKVTVSYAGTNADSCEAEWADALGTSGTRSLRFTEPGFVNLDLVCTNEVGDGFGSVEVEVVPASQFAPTVTLTANATTIVEGDSVVLSFVTTNADSCTGNFGENLGTAGNRTLRPDEEGFVTYSIVCTGTGGEAYDEIEIEVQANNLPAPVVSIQATPSSVEVGDSIQVTYSATNANSCTGNFGENLGTNGTRNFIADEAGFETFSLTCTGDGGTSTQTDEVEVIDPDAPVITFTVDQAIVDVGDVVLLTYSATNANVCSGNFGSALGTSGSRQVQLTNEGIETFTLSCSGDGGLAERSLQVQVNSAPPPTATLTANLAVVDVNDVVTLSYSSTNADSCTGNFGTGLGLSGSRQVRPDSAGFETYILTCEGPGGLIVRTAEVEVQPGDLPTITLTSSVAQVRLGEAITLSYTASDATSCESNFGTSMRPDSDSRVVVAEDSGVSTFTVTCENANGESSDTVQVVVQAGNNIDLNFDVQPLQIVQGDVLTINYDTTNAISCISTGALGDNEGFWGESLGVEGTRIFRIDQASGISGYVQFGILCTRNGNEVRYEEIEVFVEEPVPPAITMGANPATIVVGESTQISYVAQNFSSCTNSGWTTDNDGIGFEILTPAAVGTSSYSVTCVNTTGSTTETVDVTVNPEAPVVNVTASSATINLGDAVTVSYTGTDTNSCTVNGWTTDLDGAASESITPATAGDHTFDAQCTNVTGSGSDSVTVTVLPPPPIASITASPMTITNGNSTTVSYTASDADSCSNNGWSLETDDDASEVITPSGPGSFTYTVTCVNASGSDSDAVTVTVNP